MRWLYAAVFSLLPLQAIAQDFDYYVLSLSWSPNWCAIEGDARGSDQCDARHDHGWILHGLWPQFERGYPEFCKTAKRAPSRRMTREMADIMGTSGLAWHQWKKHGTCTGLESTAYYDLSRKAYASVTRPPVLRQLTETVRLPAHVIEESFLEVNPKLAANQLTVTCRQGHIQEVRICMTKDLAPRKCGPDVLLDCASPSALFTPIR
ncbi:MAG: ribonuclease T2 [Roseobacter sp.]|jgi:ribonuclease T2|nr:ribonuclease T2 [Roseobacter sp.]